ncbi:21387_t:CDS:2, partial [Dentiscutata erythropus]
MQNFDVETLVFVCYNLRPSDLLSMACVCKYFNRVLNEHISPVAELIWENSRDKFTIFKDQDPPEAMTQKTFAKLLTFEKGCQFCKTKEETLTVYWIPGVRSCFECMVPGVICLDILQSTFKLNDEVLGLVLPVTPSLSESPHYWIDQVNNTIAHLMDADDNKLCEINNLRIGMGDKCREVQYYERWMSKLRKTHLRKLLSRFHAEIKEETLFEVQEDYEYKTLKNEIETNPFLVQDYGPQFEQYKSRILQIARRITENKIIQTQKLVIKYLKRLTYGSKRNSPKQTLSIRDRRYRYFSLCNSFRNPPDIINDDQFLTNLLREAEQLDASGTVVPNFLEVDGALKVGTL